MERTMGRGMVLWRALLMARTMGRATAPLTELVTSCAGLYVTGFSGIAVAFTLSQGNVAFKGLFAGSRLERFVNPNSGGGD